LFIPGGILNRGLLQRSNLFTNPRKEGGTA
jgi:hypothetical protein